MTETLAPWQVTWRRVETDLTDAQLDHLRRSLLEEPETFCQRQTVYPPALAGPNGTEGWPPEQCCLLAWLGWQGGLATVLEVERFFERLTAALDRELTGLVHGPGGLLDWWDDNPFDDVRDALLDEIALEQKRRAELCASR